jgi:hypothetical protein
MRAQCAGGAGICRSTGATETQRRRKRSSSRLLLGARTSLSRSSPSGRRKKSQNSCAVTTYLASLWTVGYKRTANPSPTTASVQGKQSTKPPPPPKAVAPTPIGVPARIKGGIAR